MDPSPLIDYQFQISGSQIRLSDSKLPVGNKISGRSLLRKCMRRSCNSGRVGETRAKIYTKKARPSKCSRCACAVLAGRWKQREGKEAEEPVLVETPAPQVCDPFEPSPGRAASPCSLGFLSCASAIRYHYYFMFARFVCRYKIIRSAWNDSLLSISLLMNARKPLSNCNAHNSRLILLEVLSVREICVGSGKLCFWWNFYLYYLFCDSIRFQRCCAQFSVYKVPTYH